MIRARLQSALARSTSSQTTWTASRRSFRTQSSLLCSCNDNASSLKPTTPEPPIPGNDHRALASRLDLFSITPYSPGTPLLHPDGSHVFLKLQQFLRAQYAMFGFREVVSPTIYKQALWERSGHWDNYKDDMFEVGGRVPGRDGVKAPHMIAQGDQNPSMMRKGPDYGLKPMNCPGHCLLFKQGKRSWRDLPIRYADFSPLHRNEISGALSGLTRVRRFHQDDGHVFCRPKQVGAEIEKTLQFVGMVYNCFKLGPFKLVLSTRPANFMGAIPQWDEAENQLRQALDSTGREWEMNVGDGAFYGPKIDIILKDSTGKEHQTATIQLDFQLPHRFELEYDGPDGTAERPVMIHRAVLGSLERFMALLIEHYKGRWPFWMSPRQVAILTVNDTPEVVAYADEIRNKVQGFPTDGKPRLQALNTDPLQITIDSRAEPISTKIKQAHADKYSIIAVVGPKDIRNGTLGLNISALDAREQVWQRGWLPHGKALYTPQELRNLAGSLCANYY